MAAATRGRVAASLEPRAPQGTRMKSPRRAHPDQCELYSIDRDTLFSYNKVSEVFLQRMVALYVSSHYKVC